MTEKAIPFKSIPNLYLEQRWPVQKIADHFGVTRQAIYHRLRTERIALLPTKDNYALTFRFPRERLLELYVDQRLSVPQVAHVLGCSAGPIRRELDRHGIKRRPTHVDGLRYIAIEQLEIGQETIVQTKNGEPPAFVYGTARRLGIRLVIRRVDSNSFRVIRTPKLSEETVRELKAEGSSLAEIAGVFHADTRTIQRYLNGK